MSEIRSRLAKILPERGRAANYAPSGHGENIKIFRRFRDFVGRYPTHCHNVVHEDHAMMFMWKIVP